MLYRNIIELLILILLISLNFNFLCKASLEFSEYIRISSENTIISFISSFPIHINFIFFLAFLHWLGPRV